MSLSKATSVAKENAASSALTKNSSSPAGENKVLMNLKREMEEEDKDAAAGLNPKTAATVLVAAKSYMDCPVCYEVWFMYIFFLILLMFNWLFVNWLGSLYFKQVLVSPIYQCQNGHIVCNQCIERLNQCGECRVPLAGSRIRNVALENICKSVDVRCPNKSEGCDVLTTVEMLKNHLEVCGYQ